MSALIWLTCPACGKTTANASYTLAGVHVKACCPACGAYIKFVSKSLFTPAELAALTATPPESTQRDLFGGAL